MKTLRAKVTSKGQLTLPKELRDSLAIKTGDQIEFTLESPGKIALRKQRAAGSSAGCGRPFLKTDKKPVSLADMDRAIAKGASSRFKR